MNTMSQELLELLRIIENSDPAMRARLSDLTNRLNATKNVVQFDEDNDYDFCDDILNRS